jgi:ATP-dependent Lhr-like helicase
LPRPPDPVRLSQRFCLPIDDLCSSRVEGNSTNSTHVIYVSPLKALSNDVQRNLQVPLEGIQEELQSARSAEVNIRTLVRTGDTPASRTNRDDEASRRTSSSPRQSRSTFF